MGYPMNYGRVIGRNQLAGDYAGSFNHDDRREQSLSLIRGDMRRLESDQRDERHLAAYAKRAGITPAQAKQVLDDFFGAQDVIHERAECVSSETTPSPDGELIAYLDAMFVSGNDKPTTTTLLAYSSLQIIKEMLAEGLPLDYHIVESEAVYRRKLAAYGDEVRATSPLAALRAKNAAPGQSGEASFARSGSGTAALDKGAPEASNALGAAPSNDKLEGTPRTDAEEVEISEYAGTGELGESYYNRIKYVKASFARQLERELAAVTADRDMWFADNVKQNDALGRVVAQRDALKSATLPTVDGRKQGKYRLVYNKATQTIDKVDAVGLVVESYDPPPLL